MFKTNITSNYIAYQHVSDRQILDETVADGLVDVDDSVIETEDGYGFVKMDTEFMHSESGKRKYRMKTRAPAKIYYCTQCDKTFKYPSKIREHMRKHTGEKPYICGICGARFSQAHVLKAHVRSHQGEKPFKCSYCDKCFATTAHRNTHEKHIHTDQQHQEPSTSQEHRDLDSESVVFICPFEQCGFQSPSRTDVEEHLMTIHNYEDDGQQEEIVDHMWSDYSADHHTSELIVHGYDVYNIGDEINQNIDIQEASSSEPQILQETHLLAEQDIPPTAQEIEVETTLPAYQIQEDSTKKETLSHILEPYPIEELSFDALYDYDGTITVRVDPNPPKKGKQIAKPQLTDIEMDARTIEMIKPKPEVGKIPKKRTKVARNLDWIIDAVARGQDVSLASPHNRKKPKIHTCQYCGKTDKYPSKILAHMRTHTGEKPFKCEICGMMFAQRTPMRLHMRRHMNQKPFLCPVEGCGESFVSGSLRNLHYSKKHLKEKKYVCMKGCGRYFASAKNQHVHEEKCTYNKDTEEEVAFHQILYEHNKLNESFDAEEMPGNPDFDDEEKWPPESSFKTIDSSLEIEQEEFIVCN